MAVLRVSVARGVGERLLSDPVRGDRDRGGTYSAALRASGDQGATWSDDLLRVVTRRGVWSC
jgi:hypothetical protein